MIDLNYLNTRWMACFILLLAGSVALAQGVISPSPTGASLVRSSNVPINLYTGIPNIGVPLLSLPHPNGTSIPVGLNYHAGGIKVQDVAGSVGLG